MKFPPEVFWSLGREMIGRHHKMPALSDQHRFRATFGTSPDLVSNVWGMILDEGQPLPNGAKPQHLLWAFMFLKLYCAESVHCTIAGDDNGPVHEQTFRKWSWTFVACIAELHYRVIVWENRLRNDKGRQCKVTVDGTDFRIYDPSPFWSKWMSFKFKGPGLRYEVGVSIESGDIVWINGPFMPGMFNDLQIFRYGLKSLLEDGEKVEADKGYNGEPMYISTPDTGAWDTGGSARQRHETVNRRLKQWECLGRRFRHCFTKHQDVFTAVAVITQLSFERGEGPYSVVHYDGEMAW